jgi:hypothetical protein
MPEDKLMSIIYNNVYCHEVIKNSSISPPEVDGVYLLTNSGKYIELQHKEWKRGIIRASNISYSSGSSSEPFISETDFYSSPIIKIPLQDFMEIQIRSQGDLYETSLKYSKYFLPVIKFDVSSSGKWRLFTASRRRGRYTYDKSHEYVIGMCQKIKKDGTWIMKSNESGRYMYRPKQKLKRRIYALWANKIIYLFELI